MRILIITPNLPYPPVSGAAIRNYGIIHGLYEVGYEITLLSFDDRGQTLNDSPLTKLCKSIHTYAPPPRNKANRIKDLILTKQADIARRLYSTEFGQQLTQLVEEHDFDLIQFEGIEVAAYLPVVEKSGSKAIVSLDAHNAEAELQRVIYEIDRRDIRKLPSAIYSWMQHRRITTLEREICRKVDGVIAVSDEDAAILQDYRQDQKTYVMANGIFVDDYRKGNQKVSLKSPSIVFTGKMDYRPNVDAMLWFAQEILPSIQNHRASAHLYIVGQRPHPRVQMLGDQANITVTGWVDSIAPYLHAADVYIAPLRMGSGTRLKILEAMASGCAVVATSLGASGLHTEVRETILIADTGRDFATAVQQLMDDPAQRQEMGIAAQQTVRKHYDWSVLIPGMLAAYKDMGLG